MKNYSIANKSKIKTLNKKIARTKVLHETFMKILTRN